jgi:HD superfamily phosphodiesterase
MTSCSITHAAFSCFGALQGIRRGLQPDLELLYVGAMFHDIGLTDRYRTSALRFEVDGANAAREFLLDRGADEGDARKVWLSIALHTTPNVPEFLEPEIALVTAGVETDVLGIAVTIYLPRRWKSSPQHIRDPISNSGYCRPSPTA